MVKLNKIYTRTGDKGIAGLVDGSRVSKASARMTAIGDVDEANAAIGVAITAVGDDALSEQLRRIQNELFDLGADLATPTRAEREGVAALRILPEQVQRLEREIDRMNDGLQPLRSFILPAGPAGAAELHLARAVARRAERSAIAASRKMPLNPLARIYLNRLSDFLFVAARCVAAQQGGDVLWKPGATRE